MKPSRAQRKAAAVAAPAKPAVRVEIARSFSYKLNVGNYESRDFFCSQKAECAIEDGPDVSAALFQFCRSQVLQAVKEYKQDAKEQADRMMDRRTA